MTFFELVFGRSPFGGGVKRIAAAPRGVKWRSVRSRDTQAPVRARLASSDGSVTTARGVLRHRKGKHYVVEGEGAEPSVVRRDIFEHTYHLRPDGAYEKRVDIIYRYFTLAEPVMVATLEGPQRAEPGDWIMQGVKGEFWPIGPEEAGKKYVGVERADA